jgi:Domain of unknown function (DUF1996)
MRRCSLILAAAALAVVGGASAALASADRQGASTARHGRPGGHGGGFGRGYFAVRCAFSHRNNDDPIVFFGRRGVSHEHTFFGNNGTNASSTPATLRGGSTSCRLAADTSAYWVPTLLADGKPVTPVGATVYYIRRTFADVQAFPAGLKVVAGNSSATAAQSQRVTYWTCGRERSRTVPTCERGFRSALHLVVKFPNCWDGTSLDSDNHQNHLAYSTAGNCPASHPVAVPALAVVVRYPVVSGSIILSSGGQVSGHADFVNAWDQPTLERLVGRFLNGDRRR